ncbi:MAG: hypothetical protein AABZ06_09420 [Bdellovibrionota bacterium]
MVLIKKLSCLLLAACSLSCGNGSGTNALVTVSGSVLSNSGTPIYGATIEISDKHCCMLSSSSTSCSFTTDSAGKWKTTFIAEPEQRTCYYTVSYSNYETKTSSFDLNFCTSPDDCATSQTVSTSIELEELTL